jgi:CubicO group peptidase (beta-lactamase class C family)
MRTFRLPALAVVSSLLLGTQASAQQGVDLGSSAFESYIELLRQQTGIPAISGALVQDGVVVWERGLGFANVEARIRATPDTPYAVADLTQMFSAVLLLQCVEQRHLRLDQPIGGYGAPVSDGRATLRQMLSHTSPENQGHGFKYDPARYAELAGVMEHCAPQPFRKSVVHRLLERLAMIDSVPGRDLQWPVADPDEREVLEELYGAATMTRYTRTLERLAVPYKVDKRGRATRTEMPVDGINAASGLVTTVRDLARFDAALDSYLLLTPDTLASAWSPTQLGDRPAAPTGMGWFSQNYRGTRIVWHFGLVPNGYSALFVKVPARRATMILLANGDGLAVPFQLETGDVTRSLFASVFLRMLL